MSSLFSARESGNINNQRYLWFNLSDYDSHIVKDSLDDSSIVDNLSNWSVSVIKEAVEWRGINLSITVRNKTQNTQKAPYLKIDSGMYHPSWNNAGIDSKFRHIVNYMNHDSYGMRSEKNKYITPANVEKDTFGNKNAIYGIDWFAPCLCVDNWVEGSIPSNGCQMTSVSTNYPYPFKIYGQFDKNTLKGYFLIKGDVNINGSPVLDNFNPGETRTWNVWIRYEDYNSFTPYNGSDVYKKTAALRSYEPYLTWYWSKFPEVNHGSRVSGRVFGLNLAGPKAPKSYFAPKDNSRRYFLFTSKDKQNLEGKLPLPGQEFVNPQKVSGWKELLDASVDVELLKTYGYQAVMLLNVAGWGNADLGENPAFFSTMPDNLRNSISEIKKWEKDNNLRVFMAADNVLNKVNLNSFDSKAINFDKESKQHQEFENNNFVEGGFKSVSGISFLGLPNSINNEYVNDFIKSWRDLYPSITMLNGYRSDNKNYLYMAPSYLDREEFLTADYLKGGRDWFLDMLVSGFDPFVYMSFESWKKDYGNSENTANSYDEYAQYIEKKHQAIPVTIGRIVKKECLLPNKLKWKESFTNYSSIYVREGAASVCSVGDPFLANKKTCLPKDLHNTYSFGYPKISNIIYLFNNQCFYNDSVSYKRSVVPFSGNKSDTVSGSGESLLWLFDENLLELAKQTLSNNIDGLYSYNNNTSLISPSYNGDILYNLSFKAKLSLSNSENTLDVNVGNELYFISEEKDLNLIISSTGVGSKTLKDWWINALDKSIEGWSDGLSEEEKNQYLQEEWCKRWTTWFNEFNAVIKQKRPNVKKISTLGSFPNLGFYKNDGLNYGIENPDAPNDKRELEISFWKDWVQVFDFISYDINLTKNIIDYNANYLYSNSVRRNSDPIQTRLFHLLSLRNYLDISMICSKPLCPSIVNYISENNYINKNTLPFMYKSIYTSGCNGSIWSGNVYDHNSSVSNFTNIQENWYPVSSYIEYKNYINSLDISPPNSVSSSRPQSSNEIAKNGKIEISSLGGKSKIDTIEGFGIQRYKRTYSGAVGDSMPEDYSAFETICIANSNDGSFEFPKSLTKYNRVEVDIVNSSFNNVGNPHWVIEDTFEWLNSGMPSHLSQVHHSNVISAGISGEIVSFGLQESVAPLYQAKSIIPKSVEWYDKLNSTIDYDLQVDNGNKNLSLPYANSVLNVDEMSGVLVGGMGGVILIDNASKNISKVDIKSDRNILIKDIKKYQDIVYILDESKLYFLNLTTNKITEDKSLGFPEKAYNVMVIYGNNIVVGANDGIYTRKADSSSWQRTLSTSSAISVSSSPDAGLAISEKGECFYSTDGFNWKLVGSVNFKTINKMQKHRSQIMFATNQGLYQDGGSFYTSNLSLQLLDVLKQIDKSSEISVNDIDSNFDKFVICLSDGRYIIYINDFVVYDDSNMKTIHKVLIKGSDIWLFGNDYFRILSENTIRKLATGNPL